MITGGKEGNLQLLSTKMQRQKRVLVTGAGAQLIECSPSMEKAGVPSPALHKQGLVNEAHLSSQLLGGRDRDQGFKVILGYKIRLG